MDKNSYEGWNQAAFEANGKAAIGFSTYISEASSFPRTSENHIKGFENAKQLVQ